MFGRYLSDKENMKNNKTVPTLAEYSMLIEAIRRDCAFRLLESGREDLANIAADVSIVWNGRTTKALGRTIWVHACGMYVLDRIDLSKKVYLDGGGLDHAAIVATFENTVRHELAHAVLPAHVGHGYQWKRMASLLGADPSPINQSGISHGVRLRKIERMRRAKRARGYGMTLAEYDSACARFGIVPGVSYELTEGGRA